MVTTLAVIAAMLLALVVTYVAVYMIKPALLRLELPWLKLEVRGAGRDGTAAPTRDIARVPDDEDQPGQAPVDHRPIN